MKLLDPISFTQDDSQLRALANNADACLVGAFAFTSITLMSVNDCPYVSDYVGLEPVKGPEGVQLCGYHPATAQNRWFVTNDCENPELAFRVGDFLFDPTEEAFLRCRFGVESKSWSRPPEGAQGLYAGYDPMYVQDHNIWTENQNEHWRTEAPLYMAKAAQGGMAEGDPDSYGQKIANIVIAYQTKYKPADGTYVPTLNFTEEETEQISEIRATLQTYVKECEVRFITRDMSIENDWESYLTELDRIGMAEFLKVCQQAYDRVYAK